VSMQHKAFLFDYEQFECELLSILETALKTQEIASLRSFITSNLDALSDPYEGDRLNDGWEALVETRDVHQYGDFAITKYYDPCSDIGLGDVWEGVQQFIAADLALSPSPILGRVIGTEASTFDPGKMGSYFQSGQEARRNYESLATLAGRPGLDDAIEMMKRAVESRQGLYVTF
jgi:hypothetical protein